MREQVLQDRRDNEYFVEVSGDVSEVGDFYPARTGPMQAIPENDTLKPEDEEAMLDDVFDAGLPEEVAKNCTPTDKQLKELETIHDNYGHPKNKRFARWLRLGGAKPRARDRAPRPADAQTARGARRRQCFSAVAISKETSEARWSLCMSARVP